MRLFTVRVTTFAPFGDFTILAPDADTARRQAIAAAHRRGLSRMWQATATVLDERDPTVAHTANETVPA